MKEFQVGDRVKFSDSFLKDNPNFCRNNGINKDSTGEIFALEISKQSDYLYWVTLDSREFRIGCNYLEYARENGNRLTKIFL